MIQFHNEQYGSSSACGIECKYLVVFNLPEIIKGLLDDLTIDAGSVVHLGTDPDHDHTNLHIQRIRFGVAVSC